jgi:hypothetical protein
VLERAIRNFNRSWKISKQNKRSSSIITGTRKGFNCMPCGTTDLVVKKKEGDEPSFFLLKILS